VVSNILLKLKAKTCLVRHLSLNKQQREAILAGLTLKNTGISFSEINKRIKMPSEEKIFDISFELDGTTYKGWVNPTDKINDAGLPASFHVVLNETSFGHVSHNNNEWTVSEDRPEELIKKVGKEIEKHYAV
jgi:hypothetical protein